MKKITFRRCTVMAAVFAACLFAAGCKPNQPNPAPNPEPAPNPAPNPAPKPAPSPSIEVPIPDTPPVVPGGTVQEETIPNPYPPTVETVNVPLFLKTRDRPTTAMPSFYGVAPRYVMAPAAGVKILIPIPKSIKDKPAERNAALEKQLIAKLKADYNAEYKLYGSADTTTTPVPLFTDNSTVYVGQSETTMEVETKLSFLTVSGIVAVGGSDYYTVNFPSKGKKLKMKVSNVIPNDTLKALVKNTVTALLDHEIGKGKYVTVDGASSTTPTADAAFEASFATTDTPTYVGKLLEPIVKSFTVKSIDNTVGGINPILGGPWTIATTSGAGLDNLTIASNSGAVENALKTKMDALRGTATAAYKFYVDAAGTETLEGKHLETLDVIYAGL